jgi:hypothetical protein
VRSILENITGGNPPRCVNELVVGQDRVTHPQRAAACGCPKLGSGALTCCFVTEGSTA